jgi:hypothetical protein
MCLSSHTLVLAELRYTISQDKHASPLVAEHGEVNAGTFESLPQLPIDQ